MGIGPRTSIHGSAHTNKAIARVINPYTLFKRFMQLPYIVPAFVPAAHRELFASGSSCGDYNNMRMKQCLNRSSFKATMWRVDVRLGRTLHVQRCCARRVVPVQCQASKAKTARARKVPVSRKGFGASKATQQQEPWEQDLIPSYRVYYKPGFKPSRYNGPIDLKKFEGDF